MKLSYIQDPGHGWLEVPAKMLAELGIELKITSYSYRKGTMVYLEEDLDMHTFMQACYADKILVELDEVYQEHTPIRGYDQYFALAA